MRSFAENYNQPSQVWKLIITSHIHMYEYANISPTAEVHLYGGFSVNASHVLWRLKYN